VIYGEGTRQNDPVTSEEGVPVVGDTVQVKPNPAAENRVKRLFSKNTGVCQGVFQAHVYTLTPARCRKVKVLG
jgi:hypothetical protein